MSKEKIENLEIGKDYSIDEVYDLFKDDCTYDIRDYGPFVLGESALNVVHANGDYWWFILASYNNTGSFYRFVNKG